MTRIATVLAAQAAWMPVDAFTVDLMREQQRVQDTEKAAWATRAVTRT